MELQRQQQQLEQDRQQLAQQKLLMEQQMRLFQHQQSEERIRAQQMAQQQAQQQAQQYAQQHAPQHALMKPNPFAAAATPALLSNPYQASHASPVDALPPWLQGQGNQGNGSFAGGAGGGGGMGPGAGVPGVGRAPPPGFARGDGAPETGNQEQTSAAYVPPHQRYSRHG